MYWNRVILSKCHFKLRETFSVDREGNCDLKYRSLYVKSSKHQITIDQFNYIEQLKKMEIDSTHKVI